MRNVVARFMPSRSNLRRLSVLAGVAGLVVGAFMWGRQAALSQTKQFTPLGPGGIDGIPVSNDYKNRVVAYVHGNMPITREDLGEYLIARVGHERVEALVNRRILDLACRANNISVSDTEVQQQLTLELKALGSGITEKEFANQILKRFNKTVFEWKEDVIRPRLALAKMARSYVAVTGDDLQKAFEARYGPKVKCRMIVLEKEQKANWFAIYDEVKKSEEAFLRRAKAQFLPALAAQGGEVPPIHKHFGDARLEREAFMMKVGEVSALAEMPDGTAVILRCEGHVPPDTITRMEQVRPTLHNEIMEFKINQKIPQIFEQLRRQAAPSIILRDQPVRQDELERQALSDLHGGTQPKLPADLPSTTYLEAARIPAPPAGLATKIEDMPAPPDRPIAPPGSVPTPEGPPSSLGVVPTSATGIPSTGGNTAIPTGLPGKLSINR